MPLARRLVAGFLIWWLGATAGLTQQLELSVVEAKNLAQAQLATNPAATVAIAQALLQGIPGDFEALMLLAAAQNALGDHKTAAQTAKQAFAQAPKGAARLNAARLASTAHFRAGQFSRAEWWLRRAINNAAEPESQRILQQEFAIVRQANPLSVQLSFSLAPNSNINNGSQSEFIYIWNLPFRLSPDARALAGFEASASADLRYKFSRSDTHETQLGLLLSGRTFELTAASAAAAPNVTGSDYAFSVAELSFGHVQKFASFPGISTFTLSVGKNWYGGDPYTRYQSLSLGQEFVLSESTVMNLSLTGKHEISIRDGDVASDILSFGATLNHRLGNGAGIGLAVNMDDTGSLDIGRRNTATRAQISYQFARPVLGMALSTNLSYEVRDYGYSPYDTAGRHDQTLGLGLTAVFVNVSYFGFSPSVTLQASRTQSNISLFERESAGLRMGLQSKF